MELIEIGRSTDGAPGRTDDHTGDGSEDSAHGRAVLVLAAAGAIALLGPASAHAIGIEATAQPASTQAGANSNFSINIAFSARADDVKNLDDRAAARPGRRTRTPTPNCSVAQLKPDTCPAASRRRRGDHQLSTRSSSSSRSRCRHRRRSTTCSHNPASRPASGSSCAPLGGLLRPRSCLQSGASSSAQTTSASTRSSTTSRRTAPPLIPGVDVPIDITSMAVTLQGQAGTPPRGFPAQPDLLRGGDHTLHRDLL